MVTGVMFVAPVIPAVDGDVDTYAASGSGTAQIVAVPAPTNVKVVKKSATSLKISWSKVAGAKGYVVYQYSSKAKKYKAIKTLKGASKTSWVNKKLKTNKTYKYKVAAYKLINGKKKYSKLSYVVSARAYAKNAKTVNASKVITSDRYNTYMKRYLGLKAVDLIPMEVKVSGKNVKPLSNKIRWFSSNTKLVKVNSKGYIRAQGKAGTCYVYARAHNGVTKKIKVTIRDYANPKSFKNLDKVKKFDKRAETFLSTYKDDICDIVSSLEKTKGSTEFFYDKVAKHMQGVGNGIYIGEDLWNRIEIMLKDTGVTINRADNYIMIMFPADSKKPIMSTAIIYSDFNGADAPEIGTIKIAPCWIFYYSDGV
jgi:hypothetical protein